MACMRTAPKNCTVSHQQSRSFWWACIITTFATSCHTLTLLIAEGLSAHIALLLNLTLYAMPYRRLRSAHYLQRLATLRSVPRDDLVNLYIAALMTPSFTGKYYASAPNTVSAEVGKSGLCAQGRPGEPVHSRAGDTVVQRRVQRHRAQPRAHDRALLCAGLYARAAVMDPCPRVRTCGAPYAVDSPFLLRCEVSACKEDASNCGP